MTIINHTETITLIGYKEVNIYQDEHLILEDVDFQAETEEFIYLIGRVGSGKSSLLKTTYDELGIDSEDTEKAVVLDESMPSIKRSRIPALRKQMGIISQDFQLLHDRSVAKNLKFVLQTTGWTSKQKIERRIEEVLAQVGMTDKKNKMPSELSGGEQQRITIARALLNTPKIIIADGPASNLDPETAANVVSILKDSCQAGTTIIMSTHNINFTDQFPGKVYRCHEGEFHQLTDKREVCELAEETAPVETIDKPEQND